MNESLTVIHVRDKSLKLFSSEIEKLLEEKHITSAEFARIMAIAPRRLGHLKRGKGYFDTHFLSQVGLTSIISPVSELYVYLDESTSISLIFTVIDSGNLSSEIGSNFAVKSLSPDTI